MKLIRWPTGLVVILTLTFLVFGNGIGQSDEIPEVILMPTVVGEVEFPHLAHVEDFEVECKDCHHYTKAAELDMPHENYFDDFWIDCETCHVPGAGPMEERACSGCHHRNGSKISDETMSAKVVIHKSCWNCHEVGTGPEASAACDGCHLRAAN